MASESTPSFIRQPYTSSCHCGTLKYIVYLSLPPPSTPPSALSLQTFAENSGLKIYRCNCTVCHKMSILHLRLQSSPDDFVLLNPVDPKTPDDEGSGVSNYTCNKAVLKWYFCSTCGVRTFTVRGEKVTEEVELPTALLQKAGMVDDDAKGEMSKVKVWRCRKEGWNEWGSGRTNYLSVNATTLDAGQKGLDLRKWSEWGVIEYCDRLEGKGGLEPVPHEGGMY